MSEQTSGPRDLGSANRSSDKPISCPVCAESEVIWHLAAPDRFHLRDVPYELVRCKSCGLVWQKNPPPPSEIGKHYGEDYHIGITNAGDSSPGRWALQNTSIAKFKSGGNLLDLGCSAGAFLNSMKSTSWRLHGIEISPEEAKHARERTGADVFVGDIFDAPFEPGHFDVITSFDVLEHLYEPKRVIEKINYWLKPGGIYYLAVPNIASWEANLLKSYWYGLEMPRHLFMYSPRSLRALAGSAGLTEVLCSTPPASYIEKSSHYICGKICGAFGIKRPPLSKVGEPGLAWKIARQPFRILLRDPYKHAASWSNAGPALEMAFQKPATARISQ